MFTVFVTGPLAAGKRSACLHLVEQGFAHIDLDDMAKELLEEEPVIEQLVEAYGEQILSDDGSIKRGELAARAFVDADSSAALNNTTWPLVKERLGNLIVGESCQQSSVGERLAVEVALLAESPDLLDLANHVLCITADESLRIERALTRGMDLGDILNRIALQASDEQRSQISDTVIENNGTLSSLHEKLDLWLSTLAIEHLF